MEEERASASSLDEARALDSITLSSSRPMPALRPPQRYRVSGCRVAVPGDEMKKRPSPGTATLQGLAPGPAIGRNSAGSRLLSDP
jgi:hypothetical protein